MEDKELDYNIILRSEIMKIHDKLKKLPDGCTVYLAGNERDLTVNALQTHARIITEIINKIIEDNKKVKS